ncbi:MAG: amidohydrolase, partial [Gallicola sp.]|nr:amidohydrolase [Gallicola sp.]
MIKERIIEIEKEISPDLRKLSNDLYENPELAFEEVESAKAHVELLRKYGFEVEENFHNMATAFKGVYDSGKEGPIICYMAEYDALPEIGHGCGHNILGASSTGAAIVLSKLVGETGGKVVILGTPAEETSGAKVNFANDGVFEGMDVALMAHP